MPFLTTLEAKSPKFENIISLFSYSLVCKHFLWLPTGSIEKQKQKHIYIFIKTKRKVCLDNKKTCFFSCPHTPPFFLVRNLFLRSPLDTTAPFFGCKMSTNSRIWSIHGRKFLIFHVDFASQIVFYFRSRLISIFHSIWFVSWRMHVRVISTTHRQIRQEKFKSLFSVQNRILGRKGLNKVEKYMNLRVMIRWKW